MGLWKLGKRKKPKQTLADFALDIHKVIFDGDDHSYGVGVIEMALNAAVGSLYGNSEQSLHFIAVVQAFSKTAIADVINTKVKDQIDEIVQ